jgi:serine/threonine-protein kinase
MSPEQVLAKEIDRRTDVWALGVTLYWLLTSSKPFRGENEAQVIHQILSTEPPPLPPHVPAELQRILAKSLAKNADERYPTGAALQADLERWLALAGQNVNASTVANYMSELFPEATDPDRLLTRAILSGELRQMLGQQNTPSRSLAGDRKGAAQAKTITADRAAPAGLSRRNALVGLGVLLLFLVGGVGAFIWHQDHAEGDSTAQPLATGPDAVPPAPQPTPAPVQPAVLQPVPVPTQKPVVNTQPPSPVERPHPARPQKPLHERPPRRPVVPSPTAPSAEPTESPPEAHGPPGRLVIRVLPWASVFIDGRMVGTTPFEPIDVPAGRHRVELINDELHVKRSINVEVKSGETSTVQEKLE